MISNISILEDDLIEFQQAFQKAKGGKLRDLLSNEIVKLEKELNHIKYLDFSNEFSEKLGKRELTMNFIPIVDYVWEQSANQVILHVNNGMEGIGKLPRSNIEFKFSFKSVIMKINNFNEHNYELKIDFLKNDIIGNECKSQINENSILIFLKKKNQLKWEKLIEERPVGNNSELPKKQESSSSLMEIIKDLYDAGDDEMKIAFSQVKG